MIRATNAEIVALLERLPGLTASEIETYFSYAKSAAFGRLVKLAARNIIRSETVSKCMRSRRKTTGAQTRRYFPVAPAEAE